MRCNKAGFREHIRGRGLAITVLFRARSRTPPAASAGTTPAPPPRPSETPAAAQIRARRPFARCFLMSSSAQLLHQRQCLLMLIGGILHYRRVYSNFDDFVAIVDGLV